MNLIVVEFLLVLIVLSKNVVVWIYFLVFNFLLLSIEIFINNNLFRICLEE